MKKTEILSVDRIVAKTNSVIFKVSTKEKKGAPWLTSRADIEDLFEAMNFALSINCFEVAIFAVYEIGGFIYWSSRNPEILNSVALTHKDA